MSESPLMQTDAAGISSTIRGIPLEDEPGLGALTLPGYLREVTTRYAEREALVMHHPDGTVERWSYAELWERANAVARSLIACGVGKDSRVGVMMTNRPEWLAGVFGVGLAGGVAVTLSTFSTPAELEYLVQQSAASIVLFERKVLKKDFAAMLLELEPDIGTAQPGQLASMKFPFLRRLVALGTGPCEGAVQSWEDFLSLSQATPQSLVDAMAATVKPSDTGVLFFSSGSTGKAKGILSTHRGVTIQCWRWPHVLQLGDDVRSLSANGFFWSGNFCQGLGATLSFGGSLVLQPTFEPIEALGLMEVERVTYPVAWPDQWAQLEASPNWPTVDLSSMRYVDRRTPVGQHPTVSTQYTEPRAAYGNTETFTINTAYPANTPLELEEGCHGIPLPGNIITIINPVTGEVVPRGECGEIAVKGPNPDARLYRRAER